MSIASRRRFLEWMGLGTVALMAPGCRSEKAPPETTLDPVTPALGRSVVAIAHGSDRFQIILDALLSIEDQILPILKTKRHVILKPNLVSMTNPLAITQTDAVRALLEQIEIRGPRIAEVRRKYRLHDQIDKMLRWMGPLQEDSFEFVRLDLGDRVRALHA